jgi:hypothetical protein
MEESDSRRSAFREKASQYLSRAETLKGRERLEVQSVERRLIAEDSTGHGYDRVFAPCIDDSLTTVHVKDAYIRSHHQVSATRREPQKLTGRLQVVNFLRFCEVLIARGKNVKRIHLCTTKDDTPGTGFDAGSALQQLQASLARRHVVLSVEYSSTLHDREMRLALSSSCPLYCADSTMAG